MHVAVTLVLPIFAIIGLGILSVRVGLMTDAHIDAIDRFVFNLAMPALLFHALARTELPETLPWGLWLSFYSAMLICWVLGVLLARTVLRRPFSDAVIIGFGGGQGNTVMLGIPIILTAFGDEAGVPLFFLLAFHGLILITLATLVLEMGRHAGSGAGERPSAWKVLRDGLATTARNPVILGLGLGLIYGQLGLGLPAPVDRSLELFGGAAIPCALFVLGGMLTRYQVRKSLSAVAVTAGMKLIVHPALVLVLAAFVFRLPPLWIATATTLAAMPTGVYSSILANRFRAAPDAASSSVVLATALSLVTISVVVSAFLD